jgi:hypothetical protein
MNPTSQTAAAAAPSNTLGNNTKSLHAPRNSLRQKASGADGKTGEGSVKARAYSMRTQAGRLLFDGKGSKKQKFRVCHCGRSVTGDVVNVRRSPDGTKASIKGTTVCGSAWTCPICAYRIGEARRADLEAANVAWVKGGGFTHLITLTFPHEADWLLSDLMVDFDKARNRFRNSRAWKKIFATGGAADCAGTVGSLELTHGVNGWHPHLHLLAFVKRTLRQDEIDTLTKAWVGQLLKVGLGDGSKLSDMMKHSLDVRGGEDAAAYIVKYGREEQWGLSSEMAGAVAKDAKGKHLKPFGLLRASMEGDSFAGQRFREFADAFHGKRLLTWSKGLRDFFGLGADLDDADIPEPDDSTCDQFVGTLTPEQWKVVVSREAQASLESYAMVYCTDPGGGRGQQALDEFIVWLQTQPAKGGGWFIQPMQRRWRV